MLKPYYRLIAEQANFAITAWKQCEFALAKIDKTILEMQPLDAALRGGGVPAKEILDRREAVAKKYTQNDELFWMSLQTFLTFAGNVSKLLWPVKKANKRGADLRRELGVDGLALECRELRNHLEHFDERIDVWLESGRGQNFRDRLIIPTNLERFPVDCIG
jgi:hypothetical protein